MSDTHSDINARIRDLSVRADLADGTLVMLVDVDGSQEELFRAVTDPEVLAQWSPIVPDGPLTEVGPHTARESEREEPVDARVFDVAHGFAVGHMWGDLEVRWSVEPGRINLQTDVPEGRPAAELAAGWHICLAVLEARLDGEDQPRIVGEDTSQHGFEDLRTHYEETLGDSPLSDPRG